MERYFDKAAVNYGYHLVKNPKQAELSCITFVDEPYTGHIGSKWIIFISKIFNEITYEQLQQLSILIAECFKSESVVEEIDVSEVMASIENCSFQYGKPYSWYFSKEHNAFDEPPFLTDGEPALCVCSYTADCTDGQPFLLSFQNRGGTSKGLKINISFDISAGDEVELYEITLVQPKNKHEVVWTPLEANKTICENKKTYTLELPDFVIPEGINKHSAKLCDKKKDDEAFIRSFSLRFVPKGNNEVLKNMKIEVIPAEYPSEKVIWERS